MRLQSLVEVMGAGDSVGDGKKNQYDGDDGEECERSSCGLIIRGIIFLVHPDELEQEICESTEVEELEEKVDVSWSMPGNNEYNKN